MQCANLTPIPLPTRPSNARAQVRVILADADESGDGKLDFLEFLALVVKMKADKKKRKKMFDIKVRAVPCHAAPRLAMPRRALLHRAAPRRAAQCSAVPSSDAIRFFVNTPVSWSMHRTTPPRCGSCDVKCNAWSMRLMHRMRFNSPLQGTCLMIKNDLLASLGADIGKYVTMAHRFLNGKYVVLVVLLVPLSNTI